MRQVLADMKELAPAEDYGMIFRGHATARMTHPEDMDQSKASRSYGTDRDKWMSLSSLGKALEGEKILIPILRLLPDGHSRDRI